MFDINKLVRELTNVIKQEEDALQDYIAVRKRHIEQQKFILIALLEEQERQKGKDNH